MQWVMGEGGVVKQSVFSTQPLETAASSNFQRALEFGGKAKRPCRLAIGDAARAAGGPSFVLKGWVVEKTIRAAGLGMGLALGPS